MAPPDPKKLRPPPTAWFPVNLLSMTVDVLNAAYTTSKIDRGKAAVGYQVDWDAIANTTNVGGSGGFGPIVVTTQNATAPNAF